MWKLETKHWTGVVTLSYFRSLTLAYLVTQNSEMRKYSHIMTRI